MGVRKTNRYSDNDVLVVGGGTAGAIAAISAAREGARTILIERNNSLGGTLTEGLMYIIVTFHDSEGNQVVKGIAQEIIDRLLAKGGSKGHQKDIAQQLHSRTFFDPEIMKLVLENLCEEANVTLLFDTTAYSVKKNDEWVTAVNVTNRDGISPVLASAFVDASGDACLVAMAGGEYEESEPAEAQPITLIFRVGNVDGLRLKKFIANNRHYFGIKVSQEETLSLPLSLVPLADFPPAREAAKTGKFNRYVSPEQMWLLGSDDDLEHGILLVNGTRIDNVSGLNVQKLSQLQLLLRKQAFQIMEFLRTCVPGCEKCFLLQTASQLGIRETRRIAGGYCLTKDDVLEGRRFGDVVARGCTPIDMHGGAAHQGKLLWLQNRSMGIAPYDIPYRCLLPNGLKNVIVCGRTISSTHEAQAAIRMQPVCFATGQAAGTAAALAARNKIPFQQLDVRSIQQRLMNSGQPIL